MHMNSNVNPIGIFLAILLITITAAGCGSIDASYDDSDDMVMYTDTVQGFTINHPQDWETMSDNVDGLPLTAIVPDDSENLRLSYVIQTIPLPSQFTLPDYYEEVTRVIRSARGYALLNEQPVIIDNISAFQHSFTVDSPEGKMNGFQVMLIHDGAGWLISSLCPDNQFTDFEPLITAMTDSFRPPPGRPVIYRFMTSQGTIKPGGTATLTWAVDGTEEISISPSGISGPARGSITVNPAQTTTYTLIAENASGTASSSVTVSVSGRIVGVDPVTGRNQDIDLIWEQLCLSTEYQVQIAKDRNFTLNVWDTGIYSPVDTLSPTLTIPPSSRFQSGQTYYIRWRVRGVATGEQIRSPWSEIEQLTIRQGLPVN